MRKILILVAVAAAAAAAAQEAPSKAERKIARIAVIDVDRIGAESLIGKSYATQLDALQNEIEAERKKKESDLAKLGTAITVLQEELDKQGALLSEEAAERKRQEIKAKTREREAFLEDGQAVLQRMAQRAQNQAKELQNELQKKIKPHMEAVARQAGVDILLDSRSAMAMSNEFDISNDVIVRLDEAERAAKPKAAATPAKPAAAPAKPAAKP
jgi:Skp family chaperone for outer membrane proteins